MENAELKMEVDSKTKLLILRTLLGPELLKSGYFKVPFHHYGDKGAFLFGRQYQLLLTIDASDYERTPQNLRGFFL